MRILSTILLSHLLFFSFCSNEKYTFKTTSKDGYIYRYVTNDPTNTRIYTLDNGLTVYLSDYKASPKAQVSIAVKAGGKNDPSENTGLAHYLEHMMFKGTSHFGTKDYQKEKILLDSIEVFFEQYAKIDDSMERIKHYEKIDELSYRASEYAIANEYDKMISAIGGKYLNAYTTQDRTVYIVDVPSNELGRLIEIEGLRFKEIINRLFHTELETVYEEKNRSLDNDNWKVYEAINSLLFEQHPYGTQTVIGTIEHLKNPSITEIKKYFETYYKPNNVAICISGDIKYKEVMELIESHFGQWKSSAGVPDWKPIEETPIEHPRKTTVYGPDAERIDLGFRFDGYGSDDYLKLVLVDMLLSNGEAGFIDLNLIQEQKVLGAGSYISESNDYSVHRIYGTPKEGQTLDQVKELLLGEIEKIKKGAFDPWLIEAVINDLKKSQLEDDQNVNFANYYRTDQMVMAFTSSTPWTHMVSFFDRLSEITKDDLVEFANAYYTENYALVYKRTGTDPNAKKVVKPSITKVLTNTEEQSSFYQNLLDKEVGKIEPKFMDFEQELDFYQIENIEVISKENATNNLFELTFLFDFHKNLDKRIGLITNDFLNILGTPNYTPEQLQKEFYRLGSSYWVSTSSQGNRTYITLSGLDENLEASLKLFEELLQQPVGDQEALDLLIERIIKGRADAKKDKNSVFNRLRNYAIYGPVNPQTDIVSSDELKSVTIEELTTLLTEMPLYPHRILYYGPSKKNQLSKLLKTHHPGGAGSKELNELKEYPQLSFDSPQVYWTHFDMVQSEINLIAKLDLFDDRKSPSLELFNEYFSALVFQEIREAQGLAYSVSSYYSQASRDHLHDYMYSYVGIQSDKQPEALFSVFNLINTPISSVQGFNVAKDAILSQIESQRISNSAVLDSYISHQDRGLESDRWELIYQMVKTMAFEDLVAFQKENISNKQHNITLIGNKENIDLENLAQYGKPTQLSLQEIFGY